MYERVKPRSIDEVVFRGERLYRLNYLEARHMASVLSKLEFERAYVDCCDTNQSRYGALIADLLLERFWMDNKSIHGTTGALPTRFGEENPLKQKIRSEHHADRNYPVVSAASIVAKVVRDRSIKKLYALHGPFGSGYPSDPETVRFLKRFLTSSQNLPSFTRLSWATIDRISLEEKVLALEDFKKEDV